MTNNKFSNPVVPENIQEEDEYGVAVTVNDPSNDETREIILPSDINSNNWPRIKLSKLELVNFGKYEDAVIDFCHDGKVLPMACLVGPNGTGKTTIIEAVIMLCSNFSGYDPEEFRNMMFKRVRNWMHLKDGFSIQTASFSVRGTFEKTETIGTENITTKYVVEFTRNKFKSRHPDFIEQRLHRYCFSSRFDQELTIFQIKREKWPLFQELFSSVTGFPVEEDCDMFYDTADTRMKKIMEEYVLGFIIKKPKETIRHKMCSAGEKKIAKCFSTILNAKVTPSIIVIDNVLMHIEVGRHLSVMQSLQKCFPESQLIVACHSVPVSKALPNREQLFDMRWIDVPNIVWKEPWRLRLIDDVSDALERLSNISSRSTNEFTQKFISKGASLLRVLETDSNRESVISSSIEWLSLVPSYLRADLMETPLPKMRWYDNRQME